MDSVVVQSSFRIVLTYYWLDGTIFTEFCTSEFAPPPNAIYHVILINKWQHLMSHIELNQH